MPDDTTFVLHPEVTLDVDWSPTQDGCGELIITVLANEIEGVERCAIAVDIAYDPRNESMEITVRGPLDRHAIVHKLPLYIARDA